MNVAMNIIEEELGSPLESFFSYISEEPIAAASFGQVPNSSPPRIDMRQKMFRILEAHHAVATCFRWVLQLAVDLCFLEVEFESVLTKWRKYDLEWRVGGNTIISRS